MTKLSSDQNRTKLETLANETIENPEMHPFIFSQLIINKGVKSLEKGH